MKMGVRNDTHFYYCFGKYSFQEFIKFYLPGYHFYVTASPGS